MNNKNNHYEDLESYGFQNYRNSSPLQELTFINLETKLLTDYTSNSENVDEHDTNSDGSIIENEEPAPQANLFSLQVPNLFLADENHNSSVQIQIDTHIEQDNILQRRQRTVSSNRIMRFSSHKMSNIKEFLALNAFCHLTGFLTETNVLSYIAVLVMIIVMCFALLTRITPSYQDPNLVPYRRRILFFRISNLISLAAYFAVAILKYNRQTIILSPWTVPGCLVLFLETLMLSSTYTTCERGLEISLKYIIWVQLFIAALKADNATEPESFALFVLISFGFVSLTIATIFLVTCIAVGLGVPHYNVTGKIAIMGCGWYFLVSISDVLWGASIIYTKNMLNTPNHEVSLKIFYYIGLIYSILLLGFTKIYEKNLFRFLEYETIQELQGFGEIPNLKVPLLLKSYEMPEYQYLAKITGTYFSTLQKSLEVKDKEALNKWNKEIKRAKFYKFFPRKRMQASPKSATISLTKIANETKRVRRSASVGTNIDSILKENTTKNTVEGDCSPSLQLKRHRVVYSFDDKDVLKKVKRPDNEENLEDGDLCFVCYEADANTVVMDCGHGGICYECAIRGWERSDKCHMCRGEIRRILKVKTLPKIKLVKVVNQIGKVTESD